MAQLVEEESVDFNTRSSTTTRCTTLCVININVSTVSCGQWRQQGARQWVAQQRHLGELDSSWHAVFPPTGENEKNFWTLLI